ncbi:type 1 glutamine amidotransferase [Halarchaeum sp. P4]|uniref:type 1 glutamine amidotransferase n=1 Tax=Halarchaeum sp. P4 TaxID=3421639 RepID=UPI003EBA41CA
MERLRIALLNAAHDPADTARNFRREVEADLVEFHAAGGELPDDYDFDGVIVTGSRSSVYWDDEEEWIAPTREWVARADERGLPILGVCFGHQLVAEALGGRVEGMDEYEIGYREVTHDGSDPLFDGVDTEFTVFTTHSDAVTDLPPGAELLAENEYGVHAFRRGNAYGVQFHPEYDTNTAERVTARKDDLPDERKEAVLAGITPENYDAACEAKRLFDNFCSLAAGGARTASD